jgi:hypothetical protein
MSDATHSSTERPRGNNIGAKFPWAMLIDLGTFRVGLPLPSSTVVRNSYVSLQHIHSQAFRDRPKVLRIIPALKGLWLAHRLGSTGSIKCKSRAVSWHSPLGGLRWLSPRIPSHESADPNQNPAGTGGGRAVRREPPVSLCTMRSWSSR